MSFYFCHIKKFALASILILAPGTINLALILYQSGGIDAPAPYWLFMLPVFYGFFFDTKGSIFGSIIMALILGVYLIIDQYDLYFYQISFGDFDRARRINLLLFVIFGSFFFVSYTKLYKQTEKNLAKANGKINTLLRVVLHDLANQLTVINHRLKRLQKTDNYFIKLKRSSERSIEIIQSVRTLQNIDDELFFSTLEDVDLKAMIDSLVDELELTLEEKEINLFTQLHFPKGQKIFTNYSVLKTQILNNILRNAIKFSPKGSTINFTVLAVEYKLSFIVQDYGVGIPKSILKEIFDLDSTTARVGTYGEYGTGYGMPIMKQFVDLLKGNVTIETSTEVGSSGTTFTVKLPTGINQ
jgi:signal transduction histidine kinase